MKPSALTIGKFDGVHAGHARLLRETIAAAAERGLEPSVLTFDPHPACVVAPERAPRPLTSLDERCARMRELGIERIFILRFTPEVARLSPEEFVARYVRGEMDARVVVTGENFRFGHKQSGDAAALAGLGRLYGFETRVIAPVVRRGMPVSTSGIRALLTSGAVSRAARLLERPYAISGEVVHGFGIGAKQTVPTLNLRPPAEVLPRNGVYMTRTEDRESGRLWNSITNIGFRPTFGGEDLSIETYLLARAGPARPSEPERNSQDAAPPGSIVQAASEKDLLEGPTPSRIRVEFLRRVREERKFESPELLKRQIWLDVGRAQTFFRRLAKWTTPPLAYAKGPR